MEVIEDTTHTARMSEVATQQGKGEGRMEDWRARALDLEAQINRVVVGQPEAVRLLSIAEFCRGHVLLDGAPAGFAGELFEVARGRAEPRVPQLARWKP